MSKQLSNTTINNKLNLLLTNTADMALKRRAKVIVEMLNIQPGDKILDVGCGDGYYLHLMSNLGIQINLYGCDFDKASLVSAKNYLNKNISLVEADLMSSLPYESSTFDKVVMSEVCEHLPNPIYGLNEVNRVLKKGGVVVISVPNKNYPLLWDPVNWFLEKLFKTHIKSGFFAGIWNQHIRLYSKEQILAEIKSAGFEVIDAHTFTFWSLPFNHYIVNLGARILSRTKESRSFSSFNKFKIKSKQSKMSRIVYGLFTRIDKLNDIYPGPQNQSSVSIVVKGVKA
ncbi:MAG: Methyltransferase type 11 [Candidatus Woesebacteria bacterium GW2011_GWA1_37_8]|uniref:Methyltransferase type 11 n=1 Tax=Candidatus Woesebacteria bacterium GW2011_GWA1_37_8 TaxID=1618546 RepID=A0A0G0HUP5_9BACT|nr:MAG: Methyltransferase type 11 [Microgenomates group bacterium GW2011_GWC1_37_12b]KKQ46002.1 MAG: Methyltransferase type 11 [Candidatus Woesebacteria bacterium GW2011_GWA1_37_8]